MPRSDWPPYRTVRDLVGFGHGVPAVIMGGGPSLDAAIPQCPSAAIYVSVNAHGCKYFLRHPDPERRVSLIVACDKIESKVKPFGLPMVSRHLFAEFRILFMPAPSSGMTAAWVARLAGCTPIILTGMDLYDGATYADDPTARSNSFTLAPRQHLRRWQQMVSKYPAQYRTVGCSPLLEHLVGRYDQKEPVQAPANREQINSELNGCWLRLAQRQTIRLRDFAAGEILELTRGEAQRITRLRLGTLMRPGEIETWLCSQTRPLPLPAPAVQSALNSVAR